MVVLFLPFVGCEVEESKFETVLTYEWAIKDDLEYQKFFDRVLEDRTLFIKGSLKNL